MSSFAAPACGVKGQNAVYDVLVFPAGSELPCLSVGKGLAIDEAVSRALGFNATGTGRLTAVVLTANVLEANQHRRLLANCPTAT